MKANLPGRARIDELRNFTIVPELALPLLNDFIDNGNMMLCMDFKKFDCSL